MRVQPAPRENVCTVNDMFVIQTKTLACATVACAHDPHRIHIYLCACVLNYNLNLPNDVILNVTAWKLISDEHGEAPFLQPVLYCLSLCLRIFAEPQAQEHITRRHDGRTASIQSRIGYSARHADLAGARTAMCQRTASGQDSQPLYL